MKFPFSQNKKHPFYRTPPVVVSFGSFIETFYSGNLVFMKSVAKSVRIRRFFGQHFPAFGLNTDRYSGSLRIQSESGKIWTRKTLNMDTFHGEQYSEQYFDRFIFSASFGQIFTKILLLISFRECFFR